MFSASATCLASAQWRNLEIPKELSFRSAALSREESAASLPAASRFLADRASFGMTRGAVDFAQTAPLPESAVMPPIAVEVKQASRKMQARHFVIKLRISGMCKTPAQHCIPIGRRRRRDKNRLCSRRLHFLQAALEKSALAAIGDQGQRPLIA